MYGNKQNGNTKFGALANEVKINELESKVSTLEQSNQFLAEQIRTNERNFEIQLKRIGQQSELEKDNRHKIERFVGMLTDQSSITSQDMKNKLSLMQEVMERDDKLKTEQRERV